MHVFSTLYSICPFTKRLDFGVYKYTQNTCTQLVICQFQLGTVDIRMLNLAHSISSTKTLHSHTSVSIHPYDVLFLWLLPPKPLITRNELQPTE